MQNGTACSVDGCDRKAGVKGWCRQHYQRVQRNGHPGAATFRRAPNSTPPPCSVDVCDLPAESRGWCPSHYQRWYDGRQVDGPIKVRAAARVSAPCAVDGCDDASTARGWCNSHYQRWWRTGEPGPANLRRYGLVKVCSAEGCEEEHRTQGFCDMHYRRWKRGLRTDSLTFLTPPTPMNPNTYAAVHGRLATRRGKASDHSCFWCGDQAQTWAYQHNDRDALYSPGGHPYSLKLDQCYQPMCRSCHGQFDRDLDARVANL